MTKFNQLDDVIEALDRAQAMAFKFGLVEYASQMQRLSNKMQVEADYLYDQHVKAQPVFPVVVVQLTAEDFMRAKR